MNDCKGSLIKAGGWVVKAERQGSSTWLSFHYVTSATNDEVFLSHDGTGTTRKYRGQPRALFIISQSE